MSLKLNVAANYAGFAYLALIGIVMVPAYLTRMGAEAFGLISFFVVLQTFFQLLDFGLTPSMSREAARFRGGATDALSLRQLLRSFELIFGLIAAVGAIVLFFLAGWIANNWLRVETLPVHEVETSLRLMTMIAAVRWISGLYRGMIAGFERQVWLAGFGCVTATASFVLVVPVLDFAGSTPLVFFAHQGLVALLELGLLCFQAYRILPRPPHGTRVAPSLVPIRGVLQFALNIAFTSSIWLAINNLDKLMLSKLLSLSDYAHFSIAVLLASGVMVISSPISTALLPRLAKLSVEGDDDGFLNLYRSATQVIGIAVMPPCIVMAFFAEEILWVWTGDRDIARQAWPILTAYALGNGILAIGACAYYLQFGKGDLRLHVFGIILFVAILIPSLIWATLRFGPVGAGAAWLLSNAISLAVWVPLIHRRFYAGLHRRWLVTDVAYPLVPVLIGGLLLHAVVPWSGDRLGTGLVIVLCAIALVLLALAGSSVARGAIAARYRGLVRAG